MAVKPTSDAVTLWFVREEDDGTVSVFWADHRLFDFCVCRFLHQASGFHIAWLDNYAVQFASVYG